jgi:hypothetical protein
MSDNNNTSNIAAEMSLKLAQLEGAFLFLDEMNNNSNKPNRPRNITEQNTVTRNLRKIREVREMYKIITRDTPSINVPSVDNAQLAAQQFLHDS